MHHQEILADMSGFNKGGIRLGLEPIRALLLRLQNPQEAFPSILIAGTNGKGSVAAMTASILTMGGFRTGLYTSPDLGEPRERIRIDGRMITPAEATFIGEMVKNKINEEITYFEFLTAMAFVHFRERQVQIAVLEIGLGGRLDATNVVHPLVSVITNISLEHQEYLGKTLEKITREKAGIVKDGGTCLTAARQNRVTATLEAICRERGARLYRVGKEIQTTSHDDGTFSCTSLKRRYSRLICPLPGKHQVTNAALALGVVDVIGAAGFAIEEGDVAEGLRRTHWEGRLEVLRRSPTILVDGAHNPAGAASLYRALKYDFPHRRLILIFGVLKDKDYRKMAKRLFPLADRVILTCPDSERALSTETLLSSAGRSHDIDVVENPRAALERALSLAGEADLICATGSLYLVGDIKKILRKPQQSGDAHEGPMI